MSDIREIIREHIFLIFEEQERQQELERELGQVMSQFKQELSKSISANDSEIQNESVIAFAGGVLAMPAILKIIGSLGKKGAQIINKTLGGNSKSAKNTEEWFQSLMKAAENLHNIYLKPIEGIVKNIFRVQDEAKAKKIANILFHVMVAVMLFYSGVGAIKAFQSQKLQIATLEGALSAIKTGELGKFLTLALSEAD